MTRRVRRATVLLTALVLTAPAGGCAVRAATSSSASTASASTPSAPRSSGPRSSTGSGGVVTVPLDVVHQGAATLAIVPVTIDGKGPYPFILDTGASTSGINAALARQLDLPDTGRTSQVSGVVSSSKVHLVKVASWSVAGTPLKPGALGALSFAMRQSSASSRGGSAQIAGLLGSDQLSRFGSITLDYAHQQLRFTP